MVQEQLGQTKELRAVLRKRPDCRFVEPAEFCRLLVSNRSLVRSDDSRAELRGLLDPATGEWFLTEEEKLFVHQIEADYIPRPK